MPIFAPRIWTPQEQHEEQSWTEAECYRFYVRHRRAGCTCQDIMDLWLRAPCCEECIHSETSFGVGLPDVSGDDGWEIDLLLAVGLHTFEAIQGAFAADPEFGFTCKRCGKLIRPWEGDSLFIVRYHLEEHYGIPTTTSSRQMPSERMRKLVISLYDSRCFGCGAHDHSLHIDHVMPRSRGGDAAFRNLQPLCEPCGNAKGDRLPNEVTVYSDSGFLAGRLDSFEGLFW
jgi:hypothetical protein